MQLIKARLLKTDRKNENKKFKNNDIVWTISGIDWGVPNFISNIMKYEMNS